jgi:hypothetical protein
MQTSSNNATPITHIPVADEKFVLEWFSGFAIPFTKADLIYISIQWTPTRH